jgi:hypothetical protein
MLPLLWKANNLKESEMTLINMLRAVTVVPFGESA